MKKIIVRNKIRPASHIFAAFLELCNGKEYNSLHDLLIDHDRNDVINTLFGESLHDCLEKSELYKAYMLILDSGQDNEFFKVMYQINEEFAVHIVNNIYLYHIEQFKDEIYASLLPWHYVGSKKYIGDIWWEQDEEILEDINKLSILEFLKKYKGYLF